MIYEVASIANIHIYIYTYCFFNSKAFHSRIHMKWFKVTSYSSPFKFSCFSTAITLFKRSTVWTCIGKSLSDSSKIGWEQGNYFIFWHSFARTKRWSFLSKVIQWIQNNATFGKNLLKQFISLSDWVIFFRLLESSLLKLNYLWVALLN